MSFAANSVTVPTDIHHSSFTLDLGLVGYSHLEPVLLASLATGTPLLLIGGHGAGKSLLLERIAEALKLNWRHYNASLVNFDDLVGYPVPDANGQLRFIETPASIWGAEAVFIDEISRARIDIQNRLFPIIHERKVQGIPLVKLRHRWAALNPPVSDDVDASETTDSYAGSQPLDVALADRFAFHVTVPDWYQFSQEDKESVILAGRYTVPLDIGERLSALVELTQQQLDVLAPQYAQATARYVRISAGLLAQAGIFISARRANLLAGNVLGLLAAETALGAKHADADSVLKALEGAALQALQTSLPLKACGLNQPDGKLLAIHREAWHLACIRASALQEKLLLELDPVKRLLTLASVPQAERAGLPDGELTTIVIDSLKSARPGERHAIAEWLFDSGLVNELALVAVDELAQCYRATVCTQTYSESVRIGSTRQALWRKITERLELLDGSILLAERVSNVVVDCFRKKYIKDEADITKTIEAFLCARNRIGLRNDTWAGLLIKRKVA